MRGPRKTKGTLNRRTHHRLTHHLSAADQSLAWTGALRSFLANPKRLGIPMCAPESPGSPPLEFPNAPMFLVWAPKECPHARHTLSGEPKWGFSQWGLAKQIFATSRAAIGRIWTVLRHLLVFGDTFWRSLGLGGRTPPKKHTKPDVTKPLLAIPSLVTFRPSAWS